MGELKAIAIIRHNTALSGDIALALREFAALVGQPGHVIVSREKLLAALPDMRVGHIPELSKNNTTCAVVWNDLEVDQIARLLRRSAFSQEVIICVPEGVCPDIVREACHAPCAVVCELEGQVLVALSWGYVIESEGVLDDPVTTRRVGRTIALLLEPYEYVKASPASTRLRRAKKTTLSLSHDLHIYKAKFFPRMVRALINIFAPEGGLVVDPFCGSGTALLEAAILGLDSHGVEVDPVCALISETKITPFLKPDTLLPELDAFEAALGNTVPAPVSFTFPEELAAKLKRRDARDGTDFFAEISSQAATVAAALASMDAPTDIMALLQVLASDAVTKKVRYRFIGVGNGKYTIEVLKQPLLVRLREKIIRARQLCQVFTELQRDFGLTFGSITVSLGDARDKETWFLDRDADLIVTSPPYLPASSGREHYSASRALSFAVLGLKHGQTGYYNTHANGHESTFDVSKFPEATSLMKYLFSDASDTADPQRDAMRFERKAIPTLQYLEDMATYFAAANDALSEEGTLLLVVAHHHTFYSHRRKELEHVVYGRELYTQLSNDRGFSFGEEIKLELLKSAVSKARPRASEDYFESVLVLRPGNLCDVLAEGPSET